MKNAQGHGEEPERRRSPQGARLAWAAVSVLGLIGLALLPPRSGQAQGYPANVIRQMQARLEAVTQQERQQMMMVQRLNALHTADAQRLQRFQAALNAAAATRWPTGFDPQKHGALLVR